jgi:hypothetical protein
MKDTETVSGRASVELDDLCEELAKSSVLHRRRASLGGRLGVVEAPSHPLDDHDLVRRIMASFSQAKKTRFGGSEGYWFHMIAGMQSREFETITGNDVAAAAAMFRDPAHNQLFLGYDDLIAQNPYAGHHSDAGFRNWIVQWDYDTLVCLAEAVGVVRLENTEAASSRPPFDVEDLLARLDEAFGFRIDFPNPFPGDVGLETSRGVANFRAIQSLFQAWRIRQLLGDPAGKSVVEIGGGLGRTAYYAHRFGISDYTIVDIPLTSACQGYFLGRVMGVDQVSLYGEPPREDAAIRIIPPEPFLAGPRRFDLAVNFDSFTEMSGEAVAEYFCGVQATSPMLLSVNHEHNAITVRYFIDTTAGATSTRTPYWLRRGYVEEVVTFRPSA